jgi:hypothetical protein
MHRKHRKQLMEVILRPARRHVNAKGYSGKFGRRRREWKAGDGAPHPPEVKQRPWKESASQDDL